MPKKKIVLVGVHGRPSIRGVMEQIVNKEDVILLVKRTVRKNGKIKDVYFREYAEGKYGLKQYKKVPLSKYENIDDAVIVRWGSRFPLETTNSLVYNEARAINKATDKGGTRVILDDSGVSVPQIYTPTNLPRPSDYPVIARPKTHSKGKNVVLLDSEEKLVSHMRANFNNGWYYAKVIHKDSEYRVHVALGKVLALMEKPNPNNGQVAWNRAQNLDGDGFTVVPWSALDESAAMNNACRQALAAVEALGLSTGGVDVICQGDDAYVLEVNTCPTLNSSPYVTERWGKFFNFLFGQETRRGLFPWRDTEKGSSLIWKNEQLTREKETPEVTNG